MPRPIDFFIIGTPKGGTSALANFLSQARGVVMPHNELVSFSQEGPFAGLPGEVTQELSAATADEILGAVDVTLLYFTEAIDKLYAHNPGMKLVAVLRNPVDRAYSAYWYARLFGWEPEPSFAAAMAIEKKRASGTRHEQAMRYLPHGEYSRLLTPYIERFGREQLHVVFNEELRAAPQSTVAALLAWLGVDSDIEHIDVGRSVNKGGVPRFGRLHNILMGRSFSSLPLIRNLLPDKLVHKLYIHLKRPLIMFNVKKDQSYPPLDPQMREKMVEHFGPFNRELEALLNVDVSHWDRMPQ